MIVNCHFKILQRNWIANIHQLISSLKIIKKLEIIVKKKVMAAREKPLYLLLKKLGQQ